LHPADTATTIRWEGGAPVVVDGPFIEAKETIGIDNKNKYTRRRSS